MIGNLWKRRDGGLTAREDSTPIKPQLPQSRSIPAPCWSRKITCSPELSATDFSSTIAKKQRWTIVTDGLPSTNVTALAEGNGHIYVGTDKRFWSVSRRTRSSHESNIEDRFCFCCWRPVAAFPDGGVLIPRDKAQPDPFDPFFSRKWRSRWRSITATPVSLCGRSSPITRGAFKKGITFSLCPAALQFRILPFGDGTRSHSPRSFWNAKRAGEIYNELKQQSIDPWAAADGGTRRRGSQAQRHFSVREIVPISPRISTKRLGIRNTTRSFRSRISNPIFAISAAGPMPTKRRLARHLKINFELRSAPRADQLPRRQRRLIRFGWAEKHEAHVCARRVRRRKRQPHRRLCLPPLISTNRGATRSR